MDLDSFFRDTQLNMYLSWTLCASLLVVFFESILSFDVLWMLFSGVTLALTLVPPAKFRNMRVMLPWEVLLIAAIPVVVRAFQVSILANQVATFVSLAAVALIIAVELHMFTPVTFNHSFAIAFTIITTLALGGIWALARFASDIYLGTTLLTTNEALMKEFINVLVAGVFSGVLFDTYFTRRDRKLREKLEKEEKEEYIINDV